MNDLSWLSLTYKGKLRRIDAVSLPEIGLFKHALAETY